MWEVNIQISTVESCFIHKWMVQESTSLLSSVKERDAADASVPELQNFRSCSLHIVHGCFYTGVHSTGWKLDHVFTALWLFYDSPARREEYMTVIESTTFPLNLCVMRWVENKVTQKVIDIWPNIEKLLKCWNSQRVSSSVQDAPNHQKDAYTCVHCQMAKAISSQVQTNQPVMMFLVEDLFNMPHRLMLKSLKKSALGAIDTAKMQIITNQPFK